MALLAVTVLCLWALMFACVPTDAVYFTMSDVQLKLPGDRGKYLPENYPLLTMYALPTKREINESHVSFSFPMNKKKKKERLLQIFPSTGDVMFHRTFLEEAEVSNISVKIAAKDTSGDRNETTFQIFISPTDEPLNCATLLSDLCFWHSTTYSILENRGPTVLGTLSSPYLLEMCPGYNVSYKVVEKDAPVEVIPPNDSTKLWSLGTKTSLERDSQKKRTFSKINRIEKDYYEFNVGCTVKLPGVKDSKQLNKKLLLRVVDEDDNLLVPQPSEVRIEVRSRNVHKGQIAEDKSLIFIDRDSQKANSYKYEILNDPEKLFSISCSTLEADIRNETCTVVTCELKFRKDMVLGDDAYTAVLQINDTNFRDPQGKTNVSWIRLPIYLRYVDPSLTTPPPPALKLYPNRKVSIFRTAGPYARVTQPQKNLLLDAGNFSLLNTSEYVEVFGITRDGGIVYVDDYLLVRTMPPDIRLTVQWTQNKSLEQDEISVLVLHEPSGVCDNVTHEDLRFWEHCAQYRHPLDCEESCAIGTGGSDGLERLRHTGGPKRCSWRGLRKPSKDNKVTKLYSTCTPDTITCPDDVCDALEEMNPLICPQDCSVNVVFPTFKGESGRGIHSGNGICTCDDHAQCVCGVSFKREGYSTGNKKTTKLEPKLNESLQLNYTALLSTPATPNLSPHTAGPEMASCGRGCMLGIMAVGLFILGAIATAVACWRFDKVHKIRVKFTNDNNDMTAPISEYIDRSFVPENTITLNFDMTTSLSPHKLAPDPKWEYPRHQLVIEQTLGEGEFGRVLRARAKDIGGQSGYTIVAVKTLKEDAREPELADLLSEYQLLKQVSHPNIIRLLGASTLPGGPVYLIIEFAKFGSLRSYLRRSRHLKTECHMPFSGKLDGSFTPPGEHYDKPKPCKMTPTDVLSFAWQIANGMSYLAEIKLVHRDLAARNVLLTDEKVCKISDFGLTRDIYEDDAYFKRSKGRVPVKWMAPESLSDHVYTSKSDVWSFGILIWELVTLGATPYPGVQVQNLFHLLKTGYRMERPDNCSPALYKVMRSCWNLDPDARPSFHELKSRWEKMLGDQVEYLDLTPNAIHNRSYFCTLDENEENENDNNANNEDEIPEDNLASCIDVPKCGDTEKLLGEPKSENRSNSLHLSPIAQGYETPVKTSRTSPRTPTNEHPQYYTNMVSSTVMQQKD